MAIPSHNLQFGPWLPDLPAFNNPGSPNIRNALPRSSRSWGAVQELVPFGSSSLSKRCQGATAFLDGGGNVNLFAGDATDLYQLTPASSSWSNVSQTSGGYGVEPIDMWNFEYFNGLAIATNIANNVQAFQLGTSTKFADLSADAPRGRYVAAVKSFLVLANTFDETDGLQPQRVWWSAAGDATNWPTPGGQAAAQVQSSFNDLLGKSGWVQGIVGNLGNADGAVFQEHAVTRMIYAGPPLVFDFLPAEGVKGCPAPASIVQLGAIAYYLGEDGFYAFDGVTSQPIGGDRVDKTFYADLDQGNINRVVGSVDPLNKIVWWAYPGAGNGNGNPNHMIGYQWQLDRWCIIDQQVETLCRMLSLGFTLDQLYTILGYSIDNLPAPLDSRIWTGGLLNFGAFDTSHALNYFTGPNMAATLDTAEMQPFPGQRTLLTEARPLVDGGVPTVYFGVREKFQDAVTYKSAGAMNSFGICPRRASGRYVRGRLMTRHGDDWTHAIGVDVAAVPQGFR